MKSLNHYSLVVMGVLLSFGIAVGGYFIGQLLYNAKENTAEAKGLAERRVEADRANWNITYGRKGNQFLEVKNLYQAVEYDKNKIIKVLTDNGFTKHEIKVGVIDYEQKEYRNEDQVLIDTQHILHGKITVETDNVKLVPDVRTKLNKLLAEGVSVINHDPSYLFTKLNEIKPAMLKEATVNARIAASEFAKVANAKVMGIKRARQGNFYIRDVGEDYSDNKKIEKDVRVVTTISFVIGN